MGYRMNIDYTIELLEDRIALLNTLDLSEANEYQLEHMSNYLLEKAPRERLEYKLVTQKEYDRVSRQKKADVDITQEEILQIIKNEGNQYCNTAWKITSSDLKEESYMGDILRHYDSLKMHLKQRFNENDIDVKKFRKLVGEINSDMLLVKKIIKGATEKKATTKWLGDKMDYDLIDYAEAAHISVLLKRVNLEASIEPNNTLSLIGEDMRRALSDLYRKRILNDTDLQIVMGVNLGYTLHELEKVVDLKFSGINKRFNRVCERIAEYHSKKIVQFSKKISPIQDKKVA